jgi:hypothetical protein
LIYEEFNKIPNQREEKNIEKQIQATSQDYAIAYIIINEKYKIAIEKELIFIESIDFLLKDAISKNDFLKNLSLEKKEFYR